MIFFVRSFLIDEWDVEECIKFRYLFGKFKRVNLDCCLFGFCGVELLKLLGLGLSFSVNNGMFVLFSIVCCIFIFIIGISLEIICWMVLVVVFFMFECKIFINSDGLFI